MLFQRLHMLDRIRQEVDFRTVLYRLTNATLGAVRSQIVVRRNTMTVVIQEMNVDRPAFDSVKAESEREAELTSNIKSLWSAHQTTTDTAKRTRQELDALRFDLGCRLREMKSILVRTGRGGGWSAYLRSHGMPRATAERYVKRHQAMFNPEQNRLTETLPEPSEDDVRRLVRSLMPRLRKVLTTPESVSLFVGEVGRQLQAPVGDLSGGTSGSGESEMGDHSGPGVTKVPTFV
jgi:hypothetical protein